MRVIVKDNYQEMSQEAARVVARQVLLKPDSVLGLATGKTPIGLYQGLVRMYELGVLDFSRVVTFNLDEYYRLPPEHPNSYHRYMQERLFEHVNIPEGNIHIPNGGAEDAEAEYKHYDEEIKRYGRIDLQVLGIGPNGHIGFNEPGTPWEITVGLVQLSETTRNREAPRFGGIENVPGRALTIGIKTIMHARKVLLLASGSEKADILSEALLNAPTPNIPASVLQLHPCLSVIADRAAGEKLVKKPTLKSFRTQEAIQEFELI